MTRTPITIAPKTVDLDLSEYQEGLAATMRFNYDWSVEKDFASGDETRARRAVAAMVVDWNFGDRDGAIPPTLEGMERVPSDLLSALLKAFGDAVQRRREGLMSPLQNGRSGPTSRKATSARS